MPAYVSSVLRSAHVGVVRALYQIIDQCEALAQNNKTYCFI